MRAERFELSLAGFEPRRLCRLGYARPVIGAGGETRTHKLRLLRAARLPFAPLPHEMPGEGLEPSMSLRARGALDAARLPFTPPRPENFSAPTPGEGLEPSSPISKTGVLPLDDPGTMKRTRHDSNVRPQAPQACALILLSYGFKGRMKAEG